jgi:hypothetical protein
LFLGRVAVAEQQQVDFSRRVAAFVDGHDMLCVHRRFTVHENVGGIEFDAPYFLERIAGAAFLHNQLENGFLSRKAHRFVIRAVDLPCFARGFPLSIDTAEAPGPGDLAGLGIDDFEQVLAAVGLVVRLCHVAGPGERFYYDLVQRKHLGLVVTAVNVVDAHRARRARHRMCE